MHTKISIIDLLLKLLVQGMYLFCPIFFYKFTNWNCFPNKTLPFTVPNNHKNCPSQDPSIPLKFIYLTGEGGK